MIVLAAVAGAAIAAGLVLGITELMGRPPRSAGTPPPRQPFAGLLSATEGRRALIALAVGLAVLAVTRWPVAGLAAALAVAFLPRVLSTSAQRKRTAKLEALEQWTRRLGDMLAASRGLEEALETSARSAPAAIAEPVAALAARLAARGGTAAALRAFAADIDDPAGDRIAAALIIATGHRGGGVRDVLTALAAMISRDVAARREIEAERAQHQTTLRWIVIFVAAFTVFAVLNRGYSRPYGTVAGEVVLALVTALYAGGLGWLYRLGTMPVQGRFLAGDDGSVQDARQSAGEPAATGRPATGQVSRR
jgi:type II secretion system (T2SS) protein F